MKKNPAQVVCKTSFIVIMVLTFIFWIVLLADAVQYDQEDDVFGSFLTVELGCIILLIVILQEYICYRSVRYFFADAEAKTPTKTFICVATFVVDLIALIIEGSYIFPYI